jgi:hypothetical protein
MKKIFSFNRNKLTLLVNCFGYTIKNKTNNELGPTFKSLIVELSSTKLPLTKKY